MRKINFFDGFTSSQQPTNDYYDFQGDWVSQNYIRGQIVKYERSAWLCILDTVSNEIPTNATYWDKMVEGGDDYVPSMTGNQGKFLTNDGTDASWFSLISGTITEDDATHVPSNEAVFDALALKAADNAVVHLTGDETIAGVKTFSSSPIVPTPTTDMQASTKKYVDDEKALTVHLAGTETISGSKTFSDAISLSQIATPATPSSGVNKIYSKSDDKLYMLNDSGVEQEVGAGAGSGEINYCENPNATTDTTGWSSSDTDFAVSRNTTTPLRNAADFKITKAAVDTNTNYVSYAFTIDSADKAKMLTCSFDYFTDANYTDDYAKVEIYDVTNAVIIQTVPYLIKKSGVTEKFQCEFQTAIDSSSYQLRVVSNSTNTTAYNIYFVNIKVGPQDKQYGVPVTDPVAFTPTIANVSVSSATGFWERRGCNMKVTARYVFSAQPTSTIGVNIPTGYSIDTSKCVTNSHVDLSCQLFDASTNKGYCGSMYIDSPTRMYVTGPEHTYWSGIVPFTSESGDVLAITYEVPILGWSSSTVTSSEADTRAVAASVSASGAVAISTVAKVAFDTIIKDSHGVFSTANNRYTVPIAGTFKFTGAMNYGAAGALLTSYVKLYKNGADTGKYCSLGVPSGASFGIPFSFQEDAIAGDYFEIFAQNSTSSTTTAGKSVLNIERLSGPTQIAASEKIYAHYTTNTFQNITSGLETTVLYEDKVVDTHGAYNPTTGRFTAPRAGKYTVTACCMYTYSASTGEFRFLIRNTSGISGFITHKTSAASYWSLTHGTSMELTQGQEIWINTQQTTGGAISLHGDGTWNALTILSE